MPGVRVASMKRMSPPTGVQASPVATPGTLVRIAISFSKRGWPSTAVRSFAAIDDPAGAAFGDLHRGVAQRLADFPLEIADAGLARIAA